VLPDSASSSRRRRPRLAFASFIHTPIQSKDGDDDDDHLIPVVDQQHQQQQQQLDPRLFRSAPPSLCHTVEDDKRRQAADAEEAVKAEQDRFEDFLINKLGLLFIFFCGMVIILCILRSKKMK
jgi:hypothetical protein